VDYGDGHLAACHHPVSVGAGEIEQATISPASPVAAGDVLPEPNS
jgi:peptide/nickel transport system ATP-binding protein/oligopeptide transport system ATP-binding protein